MKNGIHKYQNYAVNEFGTTAMNTLTGEVVQATTSGRYYTFNFKETTINVHTLVAHAWLADMYQEGLEVDHLNGKADNHFRSLEWVTHAVNCQRAADRRKALGTKRNKGGVMTYDIFIDVLKTKLASNLSHGEMVKYVSTVHGETFNISYFAKLFNKTCRADLWQYLTTDSVNSHLYLQF